MSPTRLVLGTRGSDLALWQAHYVRDALGTAGIEVELRIIKTSGDQIQNVGLHEVEGTGFFTKEIERALLEGEIDLAVHSYKDLPTAEVEGLWVAAVPPRGPHRDMLVAKRLDGPVPLNLPPGARVGTSSLRRTAQLLSLRGDLTIVPLRGNVPTRLQAVIEERLDAVALAEAGLSRLNLLQSHPELQAVAIAPDDVCPAPSQGALAIQIRRDDTTTAQAVKPLHHPATATAVDIERRVLAHFGGGCHLPLGVFCEAGDDLRALALVASPDGRERIRAVAQGSDPDAIIRDLHAQLVRGGAERYL